MYCKFMYLCSNVDTDECEFCRDNPEGCAEDCFNSNDTGDKSIYEKLVTNNTN